LSRFGNDTLQRYHRFGGKVCNEFEILRLKSDFWRKAGFGHLGFYLLVFS